jgi:hypothetical protein
MHNRQRLYNNILVSIHNYIGRLFYESIRTKEISRNVNENEKFLVLYK